MGMRFIKGTSRNILAESTANVSFCTQCLRKKVANLNRRSFPIRPEVFLDETFCNLNHVAQLSWVDEDKIRYSKSARGPRFCIVAAGIVRQSNLKRKHDDNYHGNFNTEQFERYYHKNQTNSAPNSRALKNDMEAWLE
ncbi:uncharacterized protein PITG_17051 [Phytophthora infestans T30-4]|uniref:Uncharacterized protein n=1 Tax=Phytophthora infestans (strain T30-4) TaxID=403677 RepID=D0NUP5_PHYIT|nr:uncharacterized protein PITG_17051 [Phytophthora infestans T30-4]EEY65391.1 conserved hypothetical protein [Phytophthora infestans T30-4]|eukprot:XP_002897254.1 conserved hypothetical protein [Phytophthora infestans T30-4]